VKILALKYQNVFNIIEQAKMCSHYWTSQNVLTLLNEPKCAHIFEHAKMCSKSVYEPKFVHHQCMSQNVLTLLNDFKW